MINEYLKAKRNPLSLCSPVPQITCVDGFKISVQASSVHYCQPREDNAPQYTEVECGFPNAEPELILEYAENPDDPTETVYAYVPIELVEQLITLHGGIAAGEQA
jgi:hypothetical protein